MKGKKCDDQHVSNSPLIVWAAFFMALLTASISASYAMAPEEQWKVVGELPAFQTKAQAVAHMHSLTAKDYRYPWLTIEKRLDSVSDTAERYRYEAPKTTPTTGAWQYQRSTGGAVFATESEVINLLLSDTTHSPECGAPTAVPISDWTSRASSYGGVSTVEDRDWEVHRSYYVSVGEPYCRESPFNTTVKRQRSISCPTGHFGETPAPGCYVSLSASIEGRLTYGACAKRGNPCDVVTGDKTETIEEYSGPYGLRLVRYYHSRGLDATPMFGVGWSHNYQSKLVLNSSAQLLGISREGLRESVLTVTTPSTHYISKGANGLVVRKISSSLWKAYLNDGSIEFYDGSGRLTAIQDPAGRATTMTYNGDQLANVTGPFGHALQFEYNSEGYLIRVRLPDPTKIEYTYTGDNLTGVTYPNGTVRSYHYEDTSSPNHLTGVTDESGTRLSTFVYDTSGRPTLTERAGGVQRYTFGYNSSNSTVTDPLGTVETITFTTEANLQRRVTGLSKPGQSRSFTIPSANTDAQRRPTQETDARGNITKYVYSAYAITDKTEAFGTPQARTTSYQYLNSDSDRPTLVTEPGRTTAYTYDTNGNWLTRTITDIGTGGTRVWSRAYDSYGRVLTDDGPRTDVSDVTTYTYYTCATGNECGQLQTITNALNHVTTYTGYSAHGQPLTIADPNGLVTTLTYDARQRLASRTVGAEETTFGYWPTGLLKKVTLPDGSFLEYTYDAAHRLTEIEDSEGNHAIYTLDGMGNRTAENTYDPSGLLTQTRTRVFNTLNQLWKEIGAAGTTNVTATFSYDNNGNQTSIAAPLSRNTAQAYDELNRLKQVTDPLSGITEYGYNTLDQLISVTDPRTKVTNYTYNALGDLTQQVSPDTGTTANTYDSGGNLATSTDARSKTGTYAYDALNRVTSLTYPDQTISYTYDSGTNQKGRLTLVTDASGSTSWSYDTRGRVLSRQQNMGITKALGYVYDSDGRLQTLTLPSGNSITSGYTNGKITSLTLNGSTTILSNVLYQPFGPTRGWTWGNGTLAIREYDKDGKITDIGSAGLKTYSYDDAFRISGITDAANSNLSQSYGYDLLDRLTSATGTSLNQGWTYDANGNRLTQSGSAVSTYAVSSTSNRLSSVSGALTRTYSYDNIGSVTGDGTATFTYNDAGRMVSSTKAGVTTTYALNALGQRVKKTTSGSSTYFVYDEAGHLVGEYANTGALIQETVWLGDIPVATIRPSGAGVDLFYIHADHLSAPRRVSRPSDNIVIWRWDSGPFGGAVANEDPDGDSSQFAYSLRFLGQYFDSETGLHYNYYRDYDPSTGRYVESDPIGLKGGMNTYAYAVDNPAMWTDPRGLAIWMCTRGAFGGYAGNHTYLWDDTKQRCCGTAHGNDPLKSCREKGPSGDSCIKVADSDGKEEKVISCCAKTANDGLWVPGANDCLDAANRCLENSGLKNPGSPGRFGECDSCWKDPVKRARDWLNK
jgi:RHS repeat-associated protein